MHNIAWLNYACIRRRCWFNGMFLHDFKGSYMNIFLFCCCCSNCLMFQGLWHKKTAPLCSSSFLFCSFISHFISISWISKPWSIFNQYFSFLLLFPRPIPSLTSMILDFSHIFTSKCTWSPMDLSALNLKPLPLHWYLPQSS